MPLNSEGKEVKYTSNETIEDLMDIDGDDYTAEFTGYLAEVFGRIKVKNQKGETVPLLKAIITNGSKRITLLIWDIKLIECYSKIFISDKILHLEGCQGRLVAPKKSHIDLNVLKYELIIQCNSIVEERGFHVHKEIGSPPVRLIKFLDIAKAEGKVMIDCNIKTVIAASGGTYGRGAITDGKYKVPVQVASFEPCDAEHLSKGMCIRITGTIKRGGILTLLCQDMSCIEVLKDGKQLKKEEVEKANKNLKRCKLNNENSTIKKHCPSIPEVQVLKDKTLNDNNVMETEI